MKRQVRFGVFETNSSTCHTITIMMKDLYDKWLKSAGELFLFNDDYPYFWKDSDIKPEKGKLYTKEEVLDFLKVAYPDVLDFDAPADPYDEEKTLFEEYRKEEGFVLPEDADENLESYEETFTTSGGKTVVAFGEYGCD